MNSEQYKKYLLQSKIDKYNLLGLLKKEGDYDKIVKIFRQIGSNPFVKTVIKNNISAKKFEDIRRHRNLPFSDNLVGEATWYLIVLEQNRQLIKTFLSLKGNYETSFLLGDFEKAQKLLQEIETETGKSVWLIENQFILKEHKIGVNENWNYLSELSKEITDPLLLIFIENLSKRAESKVSYFRFKNIFSNQINDLTVDQDLLEYLCFRLNYASLENYERLAFFLQAESGLPLVDRYLILKDVLSEMIIKSGDGDKRIAYFFIEKLYTLFPEDIQLIQMLTLVRPDFIDKIEANNRVNYLIDQYTRCNYDECIIEGTKLIERFPQMMETYEIYIKSLLEKKLPNQKTNLSPLIDNILEILYSIFSNDEQYPQYLDNGLKICSAFYSMSWAKQLLSLLKSSSKDDADQFSLEFVLNSQMRNPRLMNFVSAQLLEDYKYKLSNEQYLGETVIVSFNVLKGNDLAVAENVSVCPTKKNLYLGRALMNNGQFKEAKSLYEQMLVSGNLSAITLEECLVFLYRCHLELNSLKEACSLFVKYYLLNEILTKKLNKTVLLEKLEQIDWSELGDFIELPIFVKVASDDPYQQYIAYDTFIEGKGVQRPSDLFLKDPDSPDKFSFFLREVCTIEIMHHSYHYTGTDDLEDERLKILNKLIVEDKKNEDSYIKEITELNQGSNIRKAIREVNRGRISINVQQLKRSEASNIKEAFTRLKEIDQYSKNKDLVGIDSSTLLSEVGLTMLDETISNKVVYTSDPAFISFKVIFIELRDKYLLSKEFGLDGYLSTRIRHGTLLNYIRSVFESQNIISQRDKDNNYLDNEYWNENLPYYLQDKRGRLQEAIKKFSRSIDEYTETLIKDYIQVKTEKHNKKPKGWFDYSMSNQELAYLFTIVRSSVKEYTVFIGFVFDFLERQTEVILSRVRSLFNNQIKNHYNKILQEFTSEIKNILGTANFPELISSVNLCGTRLQYELKNISEWFYLSNTSKDLILDLDVLIETAIQITNTISPNYQINPKISQDTHEQMEGTVHLIYVCRMLLENIIKHSQLPSSELEVRISSSVINDEFLQLSFKNNFSDKVDRAALSEKLDRVKQKWMTSSNDFENVDIEGDSGFDKIRRIIVFDLECQKYYFDYKIEDDALEIIIGIEFIKLPNYAEEHKGHID